MASLILIWTPAGGSATAQIIQYKRKSDSSYIDYITVGPSVSTQVVEGLTENYLYNFRIITDCDDSEATGQSSEGIILLCPEAPNLTSTIDSITFSFPGQGADISSYVVSLRDSSGNVQLDSKIIPASTGTITGIFEGLSPSTEYQVLVLVRSVGDEAIYGKSCGNSLIYTQGLVICDSPSNVSSIVNVGSSSLVLSWTEASPVPVNGYLIKYRIKDSGDPYTEFRTSLSPAIIPISAPDNYEGTISSDCGAAFSPEISFEADIIIVSALLQYNCANTGNYTHQGNITIDFTFSSPLTVPLSLLFGMCQPDQGFGRVCQGLIPSNPNPSMNVFATTCPVGVDINIPVGITSYTASFPQCLTDDFGTPREQSSFYQQGIRFPVACQPKVGNIGVIGTRTFYKVLNNPSIKLNFTAFYDYQGNHQVTAEQIF